jgi:DNA-binding FadR family transcriptional regulator
MLTPVAKRNVSEEIATQLRALILTGRYAPGDKLPPERQLAADLGVNRASLREALKKLAHEGLLSIRQGDGTRVQDYRQTGGIDLVSHLLPLAAAGAPALLRDIVEFRRVYGREVARLAAERATASDLGRLEEIASAADEPGLTPEDVLRLDFDFYVALTTAARNQVFSLLINTTRQAVLAHASFLAHFAVAPDVVRRHQRALIKALSRRDPAGAAKIADTYLSGG